MDVDSALDRFMGNEKMLDKYLTKFLNEKTYAALLAAVGADDEAAAGAAMHTLKSVCGTLGCSGMQALVVEQERKLRAGDWAGAKAMMPEIEQVYNTICGALQE